MINEDIPEEELLQREADEFFSYFKPRNVQRSGNTVACSLRCQLDFIRYKRKTTFQCYQGASYSTYHL